MQGENCCENPAHELSPLQESGKKCPDILSAYGTCHRHRIRSYCKSRTAEIKPEMQMTSSGHLQTGAKYLLYSEPYDVGFMPHLIWSSVGDSWTLRNWRETGSRSTVGGERFSAPGGWTNVTGRHPWVCQLIVLPAGCAQTRSVDTAKHRQPYQTGLPRARKRRGRALFWHRVL